MNDRDLDYYARRARQERESAERTEDMTARRVHKEMAERYAARLSQLQRIVPQQAQG